MGNNFKDLTGDFTLTQVISESDNKIETKVKGIERSDLSLSNLQYYLKDLHIPHDYGNDRSVIWNSDENDLNVLSSENEDNDGALTEIENLSQYFISSQSDIVDKTSNSFSLSSILTNVCHTQRTPRCNKTDRNINEKHNIYDRIQDYIKKSLNCKPSNTNIYQIEEDLDLRFIDEIEEKYLKSKQMEIESTLKNQSKAKHSDAILDITQWLHENDLGEFCLTFSNTEEKNH